MESFEKIKIQTLIDITNTGVSRQNQGSPLEYDQYRNWTTFLQCIGLRCIVTFDKTPTSETIDIKSLDFGSLYKGKQKVWTFEFVPDRKESYAEDNNPVGLLIHDLHEVPVIGKLTETINIEKTIFFTYDSKFKNTIITAHHGSL
jgi:hypothetical protein